MICVTYRHQQAAVLEAGAAAAEEGDDGCDDAGGDAQAVGAEALVVGEQGGVATVREPQPQADAQQTAAGHLGRRSGQVRS